MFLVPSVSLNLQHSPYVEAWVKALLTGSLNWGCVYSQTMQYTFNTLHFSAQYIHCILQNTLILHTVCTLKQFRSMIVLLHR